MDELAERGTPEFYREQADRLKALAELTGGAAARLELLEIAAVFLRMAERATIESAGEDATKFA